LRVERPDAPIPPGEKSAIKLVYRPQVTESAGFDYTAVVTTNDPKNRQISLNAGGIVDLKVIPARMELGDVVLDEPRTITFNLSGNAVDAKRVVSAVETTLLGTKVN
jgi:hypothetical protein